MSASITPSWCKVTLDCGAQEAVEVLNVTWEVQGPSSELEQRGAPGPPNPWTLALSLPPSQPNVSFTCVLSNPVDQKNATLQLVDLCSPDSHGEHPAVLMGGVRMGYVAVILILAAGICLWMIHEKMMEKRRGRN
ncbi:Hypothetical predicted protein [Marmota monax]|uniref:Ig-like domain-containing protein n=1 Tax=Marmota monax TaxID=9995 RepID=A0A5E4CUV8_MARMO|nr:Hypothetical predicted protein [Marmota monax]